MNILRVPRGWGLSLLAVAAFGVLAATGQTQISSPTGRTAAAGKASGKAVLYTGTAAELAQWDVDVDAATLTKRGSVTLPGAVTEAAFDASRKHLYVVWGNVQVAPREHGLSAFRVDPASGALTLHGQSVTLPAGPGYVCYVTLDVPGKHVMAALTDPAWLGVFQIKPDGTIGSGVKPAAPLDFGNHPHQVRMDASNKTVLLVTWGDASAPNRPEHPGALKLFSYKDGVLANSQTVAPNGGYGYQPRHLDFHPSGKWDFVSLEAQQKLLVYRRNSDGALNPEPLFTRDTLIEPNNVRQGQILGTVQVDRTGKFAYLPNRASRGTEVDGKRVFGGGENNIAAFAINQNTGEPTVIQHIDTQGLHARTISFDPSGKILVAYNLTKLAVRDGNSTRDLLPNLAVFRVGGDGTLSFVRKYDVAVGNGQDWMAIASLP